MGELRSHLGRHQPKRIDAETEKCKGWREHGILVIAEEDPRLRTGPTARGEALRPPCRGRAMKSRSKRARLPGRELEEVRERDPDGAIVIHHRTVDSLSRMLRAGTISQEMHDAARDFQASFTIAQLDPLRALPVARVTGTGHELDLSERQIDARRRVHEVMDVLGGMSSPAGSCIWHVAGLQCSVREWAFRLGWCGRLVRQEQAQGILVAALGVLAAHTGRRGHEAVS